MRLTKQQFFEYVEMQIIQNTEKYFCTNVLCKDCPFLKNNCDFGYHEAVGHKIINEKIEKEYEKYKSEILSENLNDNN